ncbi:MAG TPA: hypothetical protein VNA89_11785 [Gemmatimonadaceae bacterium]|nr:hypothetical protein [Gemmatimonadaceae bacterium]
MSHRSARPAVLAAAALTVVAAAVPAGAQTDYYNTDAGRPVQIEDAYPVERRAVEIQAAPLRLERQARVYHWGLEPELAIGILPRTQVEVAFPLVYLDAGVAGSLAALAGVKVSALYNFNAETSIPALGVVGSVLLPVGGLGPDDAYFSAKGIVTRTLTWARFHLNAEYTFGPAAGEADAGAELSRWTAGIAADRTFPLHSLLLSAEAVAHEPLDASEVSFDVATGARYQLTPRWAIDGGVGRHLTGEHRAWYFTFGSAYAFGLPWSPR